MPALPPRELSRHLAELYRRLANLHDGCPGAPEPVTVVIHNASDALCDPAVRAAAEEIARHGHQVNMRLEIRGREPQACQLGLGSGALVTAVTLGRATYVHVPRRLGSDHAGAADAGRRMAG